MENRFCIPKFDYFTENNNFYTGSLSLLNYRMDAGGDMIHMTVWYGKMCLAKSKPVAEKEFTKDREGCGQALNWLEEQYQIYLHSDYK
jgi:hypothetical protein